MREKEDMSFSIILFGKFTGSNIYYLMYQILTFIIALD